MEVEMKIRGLMMDPVTQMPIVVLKDVQGQAILAGATNRLLVKCCGGTADACSDRLAE